MKLLKAELSDENEKAAIQRGTNNFNSPVLWRTEFIPSLFFSRDKNRELLSQLLLLLSLPMPSEPALRASSTLNFYVS
jgi:hypothetical protein